MQSKIDITTETRRKAGAEKGRGIVLTLDLNLPLVPKLQLGNAFLRSSASQRISNQIDAPSPPVR